MEAEKGNLNLLIFKKQYFKSKIRKTQSMKITIAFRII